MFRSVQLLIVRIALPLSLFTLHSSPALSQSLSGLKICIDPGHGGHNPANDRRIEPDPGIVFWESEGNFQKALLLRDMLQSAGATVILTRNTNTYPDDALEPSLSARVALANSNNVDWFHSIHSNASGQASNTSINTTLMLVREKRSTTDPAASTGNGLGIPERQESWDFSLLLAPTIRNHLRTTSHSTRLDWTFYGGTNGGFSLGVLRGLLMPGELSEGSFHDFYPETRRLMNNDYRAIEAYAIYKSFLQYSGAPALTTGIIAGLQTDGEVNKPKNGSVVRLLPADRMYFGDNYNNGFYMFDNVPPGQHWVKFESPGFVVDSASVSVTAGGVTFLDRTLAATVAPYVVNSSPRSTDTAFAVTAVLGIQFSRAMDTASVRLAFSLSPPWPGNFFWTSGDRTLLFDPTGSLPYATVFTWKIDSTARSLGGVPLDASNSGSPNSFVVPFRTADAPTSVRDVVHDVPKGLTLHPGYPNPFNPSTTLRFSLPVSGQVRLAVVDIYGREVALLIDGSMPAGTHSIRWDAAGHPSGVYFAELRSGSERRITRLMLLK